MKMAEYFIKEFISCVKEKYPQIYISYDYDNNKDRYDIWHDDFNLQFCNKEFQNLTGELLKKCLYEKGIYNFDFGCDRYKSNELHHMNRKEMRLKN